MATEESIKKGYGLTCPFLTRREGFSNECLHLYCKFWRGSECLFITMYEELEELLAGTLAKRDFLEDLVKLLAGKSSGGGNA